MLSNQQAVLKDLFQQKLTCTQTRMYLTPATFYPANHMHALNSSRNLLETRWDLRRISGLTARFFRIAAIAVQQLYTKHKDHARATAW